MDAEMKKRLVDVLRAGIPEIGDNPLYGRIIRVGAKGYPIEIEPDWNVVDELIATEAIEAISRFDHYESLIAPADADALIAIFERGKARYLAETDGA